MRKMAFHTREANAITKPTEYFKKVYNKFCCQLPKHTISTFGSFMYVV